MKQSRRLTRLKLIRLQSGLSQSDVARKIKLAQSRLSVFENGQFSPSQKQKRKLAKVFGLSVEELFEPDEELKSNAL